MPLLRPPTPNLLLKNLSLVNPRSLSLSPSSPRPSPSRPVSLRTLRRYPQLPSPLYPPPSVSRLTSSAFPSRTMSTYSDSEKAQVQQWTATVEKIPGAEAAEKTTLLQQLNTHLSTRTTVLGVKPSDADVAVHRVLAPLVAAWSAEERSGEQGYPHVVRLVDYVQHAESVFGIDAVADKIAIDQEDVRYVKPVVDAKAEKERIKKEKAAAAAAAADAAAPTGETKVLPDRTKPRNPEAQAGKTQEQQQQQQKEEATTAEGKDFKREKKVKAPKPAKAPAAPAAPPSPRLIDLRVGHILKAIKHPEADSLYVSTIAMGDPTATEDIVEYEGQLCRTVCSGLNGLIPLEEMQGRKVVVVANLKPVKMRGIKSCAMVLAASPRPVEGHEDEGGHDGPVELVAPPTDSKAGDRVFFEGFEGEPEGVLNPKKKVWETFQPGFTTTDNLEVGFDASVVPEVGDAKHVGRLVTKAGGVCTVATLKNALVR